MFKYWMILCRYSSKAGSCGWMNEWTALMYHSTVSTLQSYCWWPRGNKTDVWTLVSSLVKEMEATTVCSREKQKNRRWLLCQIISPYFSNLTTPKNDFLSYWQYAVWTVSTIVTVWRYVYLCQFTVDAGLLNLKGVPILFSEGWLRTIFTAS